MLHQMDRSRLSFSILLLMAGFLFFLEANQVLASELRDNPDPATAPQAVASQATGRAATTQTSADTQEAPRSSPEQSEIASPSGDAGVARQPSVTGQAGSSATAPTPLTPGQ